MGLAYYYARLFCVGVLVLSYAHILAEATAMRGSMVKYCAEATRVENLTPEQKSEIAKKERLPVRDGALIFLFVF